MSLTLGLDVGATYTKAVVLAGDGEIAAHRMAPTGYRLAEISRRVATEAAQAAGIELDDVGYAISTGYGRHMAEFRDLQVTDLTAAAHGARFLFPGTRTVLDIGGQTMKASRIDEGGGVRAFRLNDKCAAGTGAFLEKTARYMGYGTEDIGHLLTAAKQAVPISGVCAVFAESEVISHLSEGAPPEDIMLGAIRSLTGRSVQLMKRIRAEPEYTLIGGILRWERMASVIREELGDSVNLPPDDLPQFVPALGCAVLGRLRLSRGAEREAPATQDGARA